MRGDSALQNGSTIQPPVLNADSDATVETVTASWVLLQVRKAICPKKIPKYS